MTYIPDDQCCTKCLKEGKRTAAHLTKRAYSMQKIRCGSKPIKPLRWCKAHWREYKRRHRDSTTAIKQRKLRGIAWRERALMSPEERRRTPLPPCLSTRKANGKWRNALEYKRIYGHFRSMMFKSLYEDDVASLPKPTHTRHKVNPI